MWRLYFLRLVWLPLAVIPLQTAVACIPPGSSSPSSFSLAPALVQSQPGSHDPSCAQTFTISEELSLQSEGQNKQNLLPLRSVALWLAVRRHGADLHRRALALSSSPIRRFFPRKLSPPTAEDDSPCV